MRNIIFAFSAFFAVIRRSSFVVRRSSFVVRPSSGGAARALCPLL